MILLHNATYYIWKKRNVDEFGGNECNEINQEQRNIPSNFIYINFETSAITMVLEIRIVLTLKSLTRKLYSQRLYTTSEVVTTVFLWCLL